MSFGVIINERTAPASQGAPVDTSQAFVTGEVSAGTTTAATLVQSIADYEAAYAPRTGPQIAVWDWLDVAFREGLTQAYIGGYSTSGDYAAGLALFDSRLGPGQTIIVGEPASPSVYEALQTHADANNRIGLLDTNNGDTQTDLVQHGTDAQALDSMENVGVFGSWANCAGPAGVVGSSGRNVPASAVIAGLCSRVDQQGNPNRAAGGRDFPLQYVNGFQLDPNDTDRAALFAVGVNAFANRYDVLENYGFQTPVEQSINTPFWQLNCSRTRMWLKAQAMAIGENYYMRTLDGAGKLAAQLGADLAVMCSNLFSAGGLFGDTPADAYQINVSQSVNTTATAAAGTLRAVVEARLSEYAKTVMIDLVSVPIAGVVSQ